MLKSALADDMITENELNEIKRELSEHHNALIKLRSVLETIKGKRLS